MLLSSSIGEANATRDCLDLPGGMRSPPAKRYTPCNAWGSELVLPSCTFPQTSKHFTTFGAGHHALFAVKLSATRFKAPFVVWSMMPWSNSWHFLVTEPEGCEPARPYSRANSCRLQCGSGDSCSSCAELCFLPVLTFSQGFLRVTLAACTVNDIVIGANLSVHHSFEGWHDLEPLPHALMPLLPNGQTLARANSMRVCSPADAQQTALQVFPFNK